MALKESDTKKIISMVKKEPMSIQDVSRLIGRSWVTTESYLQRIKERTGLIGIKTFRKGSHGALKVVYYANPDSVSSDELKNRLFSQISAGRQKGDFDFLELFQFVSENKKKGFTEEYKGEGMTEEYKRIIDYFSRAQKTIFSFAGNLSFINIKLGKKSVVNAIEELAKRKVMVKILCRIDISSISNLSKIIPIAKKYPEMLEIRHSYHPLRGYLIDGELARFKDEEQIKNYKKGELRKDTRIYYELYDKEWIAWLEKVFWNLFRSSTDHDNRLRELNRIF